MEIIILLILWAISIPRCVEIAEEIGSNKIVAGLAGFMAPIIAPIGYWYVVSNRKDGKFDKDEVFRQIGVAVMVLVVIYFIVKMFIQ